MAKGYRHLDVQERAVMETQLGFGMSPGAIAAGLLRSRSTISREMKRNGWKAPRAQGGGRPGVAGGYRAVVAQRRAQRLAGLPRVARKLAAGTALWTIVAGHLHRGLSPAQVQSTLARMPVPVQLSYETIYTSLYAMPRGQLRSSLLVLMRRHHHARSARLPLSPKPATYS